MKRNMGSIIILVGIGIILVSILFSSGYRSKRDFIYNMYRMNIVLDFGKWRGYFSSKKGQMSDEDILADVKSFEGSGRTGLPEATEQKKELSPIEKIMARASESPYGRKEEESESQPAQMSDEPEINEDILDRMAAIEKGEYGMVVIPLKYPLTFSVVLILIGTGILLLKRKV